MPLNYNVQFVTAATRVAMLAKAHSDGTLDKQLTILSRPKLLIIDELGYLPFEANAAHLFFQLVSRRYERGSILITSNRSVGKWGSVSLCSKRSAKQNADVPSSVSLTIPINAIG
jgi:DNA replication protein DnaC